MQFTLYNKSNKTNQHCNKQLLLLVKNARVVWLKLMIWTEIWNIYGIKIEIVDDIIYLYFI